MAKETADKKSEKYFADQLDDEEVQFMFRKHPIVMRKGLVFGLLGPLLGIVPAAIWPTLGFGWFFGGLAIGVGVGGLIFLPSWIAWYYSIFIVTDRRLIQITRRGLFRKSFVDLGLNQIQSLNYQVNGLQATLLGYGTILVQTYMGDMVVHNVLHPAKIYKKFVTVLDEQGIKSADMNKAKPTQAEETVVDAEEA